MNANAHISRHLQALSEAADKLGLEALAATYDDEGTLRDHAREGEVLKGREAIVEYWGRIIAALPGVRLEWGDVVGQDRTVAAQLRLTGRHVGGDLRGRPPAGNLVALELCSVWKLAADRDTVVEQNLYYDGDNLDGQLARGVI